MKISKGPYPFYIPDPQPDRAHALAELADHNGLTAAAFVGRDEPHWLEMLESISLDECDVELAERADGINRRRFLHLQERLEEYNRSIKPIKGTELPEIPVTILKKSPKKSRKMFGRPVTHIIRWMGAEGWDKDQAFQVLRSLDIEVAVGTVHAQLRGGVKGNRGEIPELTEDQIDQLYDLLD